MTKLLSACCALVGAMSCAGAIQIANLKIGQIDNGTKVQVSWHIDGAGWSAYYSVALTRAETPDAPATSRTIIEPYDLNFWQTSPDCSLTDTPPVSGKRYYYWLHVSADFSFQMAYLMGYYDNIKTAPCIGPLVGWTGTLADAPKAPTTLTASVDAVETGITLSWNAGENAKAYNVYRADSEDLSQMVMIAQDFASLSGVDHSPVPGRYYYYAVKSVNDGMESSDFSPIAKGRRALLPPTDVKAGLVESGTAAEILWTAEPCATSYDIYAGLSAEFEEAAKIAETLTDCCYTNVLSGDFAVRSHWYWIVSKNDYVESKPSDSAKISVPPPTAVEVHASGANIASGSITLVWSFPDGRELPKGMTFSVVRKVNDGKSSAVVLTSSESAMSYTDSTWGAAGKTDTISYWIQPNADGWPLSDECVTRRRYGISVGYSSYATRNVPLVQAYNDAQLFRSLCVSRGGFGDEDMKFLANANAKTGNIRSEISAISETIKPGDTFVFYISTHGGTYSRNRQAVLATYDGHYAVRDLQTDIRLFPQSVKVICIIMACHSASLIGAPLEEDSSLSDRVNAWLADCGLAQCLGNVAWVVSCGVNQSSYNSRNNSLFGESFIDNGWSKGYADCRLVNSPTYAGVESDGQVTFLDLAKYAQCFAVGKSDKLDGGDDERATVAFENEGLLGNAIAGSCPSPRPSKPATTDGLTATSVGSSSLKIAWQPASGAQRYRIFRYPEGDENSKLCVSYLCTTTSFIDNGLIIQKPYVYQVQSVNPGAFGDLSEGVVGQSGSKELLEFLEKCFSLKRDVSTPEEYEQARCTIGANGATYEASCVAGLEPERKDSKFVTKITIENGMPKVTWEPALNGDGVKLGVRTYTVFGSKEINGPWFEVNGDEINYNFFKTSVSFP